MSDVPLGYHAALTGAALFDRSHTAKIEVTGPDAAMFLGNLCTNDIKKLAPGTGCPAFLCDPRAKVKFQTWIYNCNEFDGVSSYWIETTPGRNTDLFKYLDRYLISERVEIADRTDEFVQFHVAGPGAAAVVETATGVNLADAIEFSNREGTLRRRDLLGMPGYDVLIRKDGSLAVERLFAAGAIPATGDVFETLRIEAGTPFFGPDIDETRFVMEVAGAARAVSYTKGCYLGQEPIVMARDRAGHVNRAFLGMKVLDGGPLPAGAKVFHDGQEVGVVTSSCHSPRLGAPIALGYLRWKHQVVGTRMEAETPTGRQAVEVLGMPPVR